MKQTTVFGFEVKPLVFSGSPFEGALSQGELELLDYTTLGVFSQEIAHKGVVALSEILGIDFHGPSAGPGVWLGSAPHPAFAIRAEVEPEKAGAVAAALGYLFHQNSVYHWAVTSESEGVSQGIRFQLDGVTPEAWDHLTNGDFQASVNGQLTGSEDSISGFGPDLPVGGYNPRSPRFIVLNDGSGKWNKPENVRLAIENVFLLHGLAGVVDGYSVSRYLEFKLGSFEGDWEIKKGSFWLQKTALAFPNAFAVVGKLVNAKRELAASIATINTRILDEIFAT